VQAAVEVVAASPSILAAAATVADAGADAGVAAEGRRAKSRSIGMFSPSFLELDC
jgi:hypothetical protein